jgi:hypothetical protein
MLAEVVATDLCPLAFGPARVRFATIFRRRDFLASLPNRGRLGIFNTLAHKNASSRRNLAQAQYGFEARAVSPIVEEIQK